MKKLGLFLAAIVLVSAVSAQNADPGTGASSFGVVVYAEGDVVSVIRDARRIEYDAFTGELLGFAVYPGDIIQTDPDTYVEIQLLPSRSVVKVAENTSFTVDQISGTGEGVFDLAYGRLRARVGRLAGGGPFEIRGIGATAGVRGTDFGTDVIVTPAGGSSFTRIYCFEGEVQVELHDQPQVAATAAESEGVPEPIVVGPNQMVTATIPAPSSKAIAAEPVAEAAAVEVVSAEISDFWQRENFVVEPEAPEAVLAQFPNLRQDASDRLGVIEFLQNTAPEATPPPEPEPAPEVLAPTPIAVESESAAPVGQAPVSLGGDEAEEEGEATPEERRERLITATRATGIAMTSIGLLADAAAVTLYFWGDQILPSVPAASDPDILMSVGAAGGVFLIGGILALLFSMQLGQ